MAKLECMLTSQVGGGRGWSDVTLRLASLVRRERVLGERTRTVRSFGSCHLCRQQNNAKNKMTITKNVTSSKWRYAVSCLSPVDSHLADDLEDINRMLASCLFHRNGGRNEAASASDPCAAVNHDRTSSLAGRRIDSLRAHDSD